MGDTRYRIERPIILVSERDLEDERNKVTLEVALHLPRHVVAGHNQVTIFQSVHTGGMLVKGYSRVDRRFMHLQSAELVGFNARLASIEKSDTTQKIAFDDVARRINLLTLLPEPSKLLNDPRINEIEIKQIGRK